VSLAYDGEALGARWGEDVADLGTVIRDDRRELTATQGSDGSWFATAGKGCP
jgi:hypothetical protein